MRKVSLYKFHGKHFFVNTRLSPSGIRDAGGRGRGGADAGTERAAQRVAVTPADDGGARGQVAAHTGGSVRNCRQLDLQQGDGG